MRFYKNYFYFILISSFLTNGVSAQLVVDGSLNNEQLARKIVGHGVTISNILVNCPSSAIGGFTSTGLPINDGLLLSTGKIINAVGPNGNVSTSFNHGESGDFQLDALAGSPTFDACSIEFDFTPQCDNLSISFFFASEEYDEYIGREFNDVFALYITGQNPNNSALPYNNLNLATVPSTTTPITVNSINSLTNSHLYIDNTAGTILEFDGYTRAISSSIDLSTCETYHIKIAIADVTDGIFDSGIFIQSNSIQCNNVIYDVQSNAENAIENCTPGKITFCRDYDLTLPQTFTITTAGTATNGIDYTIPTSITIPANQQCYDLIIPVIRDYTVEPTESIFVIYQNGNCPTFDTITIYIQDEFVINAGSDKTICVNEPVQIGNANNSVHTLNWSNPNDLNADSIARPTVLSSLTSLTNPATVYYTLTATRNDGCVAVDSLSVVFNPNPHLDFTPTNHCQNETFNLVNNSALNDTIGAYRWDLNNGSVSFQNSPTIAYNTPGDYTIELIANNSYGCYDTLMQPITIYPLPQISFTSADTCAGKSNCFTNTSSISDGFISSWVWNYGDNSNFESIENPCHTYSTNGIFNVQLIGSSNQGCVALANAQVTTYPNPIVSFSATDHCLNSAYPFNNYSTLPFGSISSYSWNFNQGSNFSTLHSPTYTFPTTGMQTITLTATSTKGCVDSLTKTINVHNLPIADFSADLLQTCERSCIDFSATDNPNNTSITAYNWSFSNGFTGLGHEFSQCFNSSGFFDVQLIITDANLCKDTIIKANYIEIYPSPDADFTTNLSVTSLYNPILEIENNTVNDCNNWSYTFGDGTNYITTNYEKDLSHNYTSAGDYLITQIVSNSYGCSDSLSRTLRVNSIKTLFIPNSFTPDNDGINDTFIPRGLNLSPFKLEIFDRWGSMIFTSTDIDKHWDGTHKGTTCISDVYIYKITYGSDENPIIKTGTVTLIK